MKKQRYVMPIVVMVITLVIWEVCVRIFNISLYSLIDTNYTNQLPLEIEVKLKVDERELPYYFIHAEYIPDEGADVETQVEASELMLEDLKGKFADIQSRYNDKRLILRLWCNTEKTAYQEFLMAHGFRPMRVLPILVRKLTEDDVHEKDSIVLPGNALHCEGADDGQSFDNGKRKA